MKAEKTVMVRTPEGMVEAKSFYVWKEEVAGAMVSLALHVAPRNPDEVMISELSTGFNVEAQILRPGTREPLTVTLAKKLPGRLVKRQSRTAFHYLLKRVGGLDFIRSVATAQIQVAKLGESLVEEYACKVIDQTTLAAHKVIAEAKEVEDVPNS